MKSIKESDLQTIVNYQATCKYQPPVTTHATFKLSDLESLVEHVKTEIKKRQPDKFDKNGKINQSFESRYHTVCITFVREMIDQSGNLLTHHSGIKGTQLYPINSVKAEENTYYTQVIPIISGCIAELDQKYKNQSFEYLSDGKGNIKIVHPGGEGTGLIPPPPTGGK
ncbi:MAG: hypothetical protein ACKVOW_12815 [Chitinophagaceae bacterium]